MTDGLNTPLAELTGFQTRFATKLKKLHIETVRDLLYFFPARYEDFSVTYPIADLVPHAEVTIQGVVAEVEARRAWRRGMTVVEAQIEDATGRIRAVWFNQPYLKETLRPGRLANFSGKVSLSKDGEMYFSHPTYEFISGRNAGGLRTTAARCRPSTPGAWCRCTARRAASRPKASASCWSRCSKKR